MKYRVEGADAQTGAPRTMTVDAASEAHASDIAQREGMFISRVMLDGDTLDRVTDQGRQAMARVINATAAAFDPQQHAEAKRTRHEVKSQKNRMKVAEGKHVQWVRLTGSSEFTMVVVVAIGVFLGMTAFSCVGGFIALAGLAGGMSQAASP